VGSHVFDKRFGVTLLARQELVPSGTYEPLGWPCYGSGRVGLWATPRAPGKSSQDGSNRENAWNAVALSYVLGGSDGRTDVVGFNLAHSSV